MISGILITLYVLCMDAILPQFKKPSNRKWAIFHVIYITLLVGLTGAGTAGDSKLSEINFIDNREYPGGVAAFINSGIHISVYTWDWAVYVIPSWLQDGYVVSFYSEPFSLALLKRELTFRSIVVS